MDRRQFRSRSGLLASVVACALVLAGCNQTRQYVHNGFKVGPNYCPPSAPIEKHWIDASDVRVREDRQIPCRWWRVFNDPLLNEIVNNAYSQNLTLRQAGFRILQARAQLGIARGGLFPQGQDATGSFARRAVGGQVSDQFFDQWSSAFNLAWELDFWGRFRRAVLAAEASLDASVADYDDVLVTLVADAANNYVVIRTHQERIRLLEENIKIQRGILSVGEERLGLTATSVDVEQVRANLLQNEAQIEQLQIELRQAANRLCILLGMPPRDLQQELGIRPIPSAPPEIAVGIPADLLGRRPDVRRAERQAAAQAEEIGIAVADLYPAISINGTLGYQARNFSDLFSSQSLTGAVGPSFQWNLLNYGRIANNIRLQDARLCEAVALYQQTVLQASEEAENGLVAFLRAQRRARLLDESSRAASKAVQVIREQLGVGKIDFNQYAVIQQALIQQQDLWAQARGEIAVGLIEVYRALGGGWEIRFAGGAAPAGEPIPGPPGEPMAPMQGPREEIPVPDGTAPANNSPGV
jgi:NodT family efflux transporter outer membrane factor (OMF) lipoprotein